MRQMAERLGWNVSSYQHLETGTRKMDVETVLRLAFILDVAPVHLICPWNDEDAFRVEEVEVPAAQARAWVRGHEPLPSTDDYEFFRTVPRSEFQTPHSSE